MKEQHTQRIPHEGSLCRLTGDHGDSAAYVIEIVLEGGESHELIFRIHDFEFTSRLFAILDTESRGVVTRQCVKDFVTLRCPVFWRRDEDLRRLDANATLEMSPTFDEVWNAVVACSKVRSTTNGSAGEIGVEGWMVFCRFVALAQYLEAKRRFSARHLQQTMRHRNSPRGSEVVVVDVPPPVPPVLLSPQELAEYELKTKSSVPLPELDLDHSLLAAHDAIRRRAATTAAQGMVRIALFGNSFTPPFMSSGSPSSASNLEFTISLSENGENHATGDALVVRRSMEDLKWLNDTFTSHKILGGTLCGRILPPFPTSSGRILASQFQSDDNILKTSLKGTNGAIAAAAVGVGMIRNVARSLWGNYVGPQGAPSPQGPENRTQQTAPSSRISKKTSLSFAIPESYYNPNSPTGKARHLERYLNYLLEHPALSTSFPLNTILKASQSGLEAAKRTLEERTKVTKELKEQTPHLDDGKLMIPFWPASASGLHLLNLPWVRTAAQAAMALKVHGILLNSGLPSASARLQHASLPSFDNLSNVGAAWEDDEVDSEAPSPGPWNNDAVEALAHGSEQGGANNFEQGVVQVQSELDNYDLLPLPYPAAERRILSAGSSATGSACGNNDGSALNPFDTSEQREQRFHYGSVSPRAHFPHKDEASAESAFLGDFAVDENIDKLREVIGSVDNTLSRGLASSGGIGRSRRESLALHLDTVRGFDSLEGLRGKFVCQRALLKGVSGLEHSRDVFEESDLALIDDMTWQAALADSAVSAAEDVRSAVRVARTAASAKAAADAAAFAAQNACESGDFASIDEARAAQTRSSIAQSHAIHAAVVEHEAKTVKRRATMALAHDVKCWNVHRKRELLGTCIAFARSQHEATRRAVDAWSCLRDGFIGSTAIPTAQLRKAPPQVARQERSDPDEVTATIFGEPQDSDIAAAGQNLIVPVEHQLLANMHCEGDLDEKVGAEPSQSTLPLVAASPIAEAGNELCGSQSADAGCKNNASTGKLLDMPEQEGPLTASMESLVDGLMNWGGQFDTEDDFALPSGMAASIALEETGALGTQKIA